MLYCYTTLTVPDKGRIGRPLPYFTRHILYVPAPSKEPVIQWLSFDDVLHIYFLFNMLYNTDWAVSFLVWIFSNLSFCHVPILADCAVYMIFAHRRRSYDDLHSLFSVSFGFLGSIVSLVIIPHLLFHICPDYHRSILVGDMNTSIFAFSISHDFFDIKN